MMWQARFITSKYASACISLSLSLSYLSHTSSGDFAKSRCSNVSVQYSTGQDSHSTTVLAHNGPSS